MTMGSSRGITRSRSFLPSFSVVLGAVMLAASWLGGNPGAGALSFGVLAVFGLLATGGLAYLLAVAWFRWRG